MQDKKIVSLSFECFMTGDCLVYNKKNEKRARMQLDLTLKVDFLCSEVTKGKKILSFCTVRAGNHRFYGDFRVLETRKLLFKYFF